MHISMAQNYEPINRHYDQKREAAGTIECYGGRLLTMSCEERLEYGARMQKREEEED